MPDIDQPLPLFIIRYRHHGEVIDVSGRGSTGEDAFQRYLVRLKSWGKDAKDYKFVGARRVPEREEHGGA